MPRKGASEYRKIPSPRSGSVSLAKSRRVTTRKLLYDCNKIAISPSLRPCAPANLGRILHASFSRSSANPAMGRPSLLPSQPHQSVASPRERDQLFGRIRLGLQKPGSSCTAWLAGGDGEPPGRPLLLRAE